ncbi:MAG: FecR domain-containing protein [Myxococcota bacterium]
MNKNKFTSEIRKLHHRQKLDPEMSRVIWEKIQKKEFSSSRHPVFWMVLAMSQIALLVFVIYFFVFDHSQTKVQQFSNISFDKTIQVTDIKSNKEQDVKSESPNFILDSTDSTVALDSSSQFYYFNSKVKLKVLSDSAKLKRAGDNEVKLVNGRVFFEVSPGDKIFKVKACDCTIEVVGTSFTVDSQKLIMHKGVVRLIDQNQQKQFIKAGEEYEFSTPEPVTKSKSLKLKVKERIKNKSYQQAIALLESAVGKTTDVDTKIKYKLDITSIYGAYLHDFESACRTMRSLVSDTSSVETNPGFKLLWSRYRCQH